MINQIAADKVYDAVCETVSRNGTAANVLRVLLSEKDYGTIAAVADRIRESKSEHSRARMSILRVTLKRACKALELEPLGIKLDKESGRHYLAALETAPDDGSKALAKALELVIENIDKADVIAALHEALGLNSDVAAAA